MDLLPKIGSYFAMDGGGEGSVCENAQAFNNACDLYRINLNKLLKVIEIRYQWKNCLWFVFVKAGKGA